MSLKNKISMMLLAGCCMAVQSYAVSMARSAQAGTEQTVNKVYINQKQIFRNPSDAVLGNPKGSKEFAVFIDPYCSHCRQYQSTINQAVQDMPDLRVVLKDFPIFGDPSVDAVTVLKAANMQGKYKEMQALIHQQNDSLTMPQLLELAKQVRGLNTDLLAKAVTRNDISTMITDTTALAARLGIDATPTVVIDMKVVPGEMPLDDLKDILNKAT